MLLDYRRRLSEADTKICKEFENFFMDRIGSDMQKLYYCMEDFGLDYLVSLPSRISTIVTMDEDSDIGGVTSTEPPHGCIITMNVAHYIPDHIIMLFWWHELVHAMTRRLCRFDPCLDPIYAGCERLAYKVSYLFGLNQIYGIPVERQDYIDLVYDGVCHPGPSLKARLDRAGIK